MASATEKSLASSAPVQQRACKVYFAGSIRGGRDDAALYAGIVAHMQSLGAQVLTEHVADPSMSACGEVNKNASMQKATAVPNIL